MRRKTDPNDLGTIEDATTYPLPVFARLAGVGKHAITQMRRQGLKVCRTNGRCYVRGRDFSEFLGRLASDEGAAQ